MPPWETLVELMLDRAAELPNKPAYTFLEDGETEERTWTYADLDRQARSIAVELARRGVMPGDRALLFYPPGLDFIAGFFGCLAAGVIAVPCYPPGSPDLAHKATGIAKDCGAKVALTVKAFQSLGDNPEGDLAWLANLKVLATDSLDVRSAEDWKRPNIDGGSLAFLQYTSGSTSDPKGVKVTHGNILANEEMIKEAFSHSSHSSFVGWLPLYHDMGLIGNVLQPFFIGSHSVLMSPIHFLAKPIRWLRAISKYQAKTSGAPNFGYDLCVRKTKSTDRDGLDLSSWTLAFNGAEPIRSETLNQFVNAFGPHGFRKEAFYPCYGLAEATLFVSGGDVNVEPQVLSISQAGLEKHVIQSPHNADDERKIVGCGRTWQGLDLRIVDPENSQECPSSKVGEIWVRGKNVTTGYWGSAGSTTETFQARIQGDPSRLFCRTGDYGFLVNSELFVTGRRKDLIIIRGRNIYPQDIEKIVEESHSSLRPGCGVAFSIVEVNEERLVVVHEIKESESNELDSIIEEIHRSIMNSIQIPCARVILVRPHSIPKTSSGKLRRIATKMAALEGRLDVLHSMEFAQAPMDLSSLSRAEGIDLPMASASPAHKLLQLVHHCVGLKPDDSRFSVDEMFSRYHQSTLIDLGFDSLSVSDVSIMLQAVSKPPEADEDAGEVKEALI